MGWSASLARHATFNSHLTTVVQKALQSRAAEPHVFSERCQRFQVVSRLHLLDHMARQNFKSVESDPTARTSLETPPFLNLSRMTLWEKGNPSSVNQDIANSQGYLR